MVGVLALMLGGCGENETRSDPVAAVDAAVLAQIVPSLVVAGQEAALVVDGPTGYLLSGDPGPVPTVRVPELQALSGSAFADGFALLGVACTERRDANVCDAAELLIILLDADGTERARTQVGLAAGDQIDTFGAALVGRLGQSLYVLTERGLLEVSSSGEVLRTLDAPAGDVCAIGDAIYVVSEVTDASGGEPAPGAGVATTPGTGSAEAEGAAVRFTIAALSLAGGWEPVDGGVLDASAVEAPSAFCADGGFVAGTDLSQPRHRWTPDLGWREHASPGLEDARARAVSSTHRAYVFDSSGEIVQVGGEGAPTPLGVDLPPSSQSRALGAAVPPGLFVDDSAPVRVACLVIDDPPNAHETACAVRRP